MNNKIIKLYCDTVIKPLEMRKRELEYEIKIKKIVNRINKKELELVSNLFYEKLCYLSKLMEKLENDE